MLYINDIEINVKTTLLETIAQNTPAEEYLGSFSLDYNHIRQMKILKSHDNHLTSIELHLEYLTAAEVEAITSGAYHFQILIGSGSAVNGREKLNFSSNFFVVNDYEIVSTDDESNPFKKRSNSLKVQLYSWTVTRMSHENNLGFLNWGASAVDTSMMKPKQYFLDKMQKDFAETYGGLNSISTSNTQAVDIKEENPFEIVSFEGSDILVTPTAPASGYLLKGENNLEILGEFLSAYPPLLTPFGWLIDDLPNGEQGNTRVRITDWFSTSSWPINTDLTKMINSKDPELYAFTNFRITDSKTFFNNLKFQASIENPIIQIIHSSSATPVTLDASLINKKITIMNPTDKNLVGKTIKNPKVKRIYTFMSEYDVANMEAYRRKLRYQKPTLETLHFENLAYHDININEAIQLPTGTGTGVGSPRIGIGYAFEYIFERTKLLNSETNHLIVHPDVEAGIKTFKMTVNAQYLITNDNQDAAAHLKLSKDEVGSILADIVPANGTIGTMNYNGYGPAPLSISRSYKGLKIAGTPGDIASYGLSLINEGFQYVYGAEGPHEGGYDCSGFTMTAVCSATGLKKFGSPHSEDAFPRTANYQYLWCRKFAEPVGYDDIEAGDILFLTSDGGFTSDHVGIAKSKTEVMASSSYASPKRRASTCTPSNPCRGAVIQPRGSDARTHYWDKKLLGAFRIKGSGGERPENIVGEDVGVFCKQIAAIESSGLPSGVPAGYEALNSGSGAKGAYQFVPSTADAIQKQIGTYGSADAWSPENQDKMCAYYEDQIIQSLQRNNIPITLRNVYLSWQQGPTGAREILNALSNGTPVSDARARNMASNMHYQEYSGVESYIEDYDRFMIEKGVDPYAKYG